MTWTVRENDSCIGSQWKHAVVDEDGYPIALIEDLAQAKLIAAAPDMLAALKAVTDPAWEPGCGDGMERADWEAARAAITKATT